MKKILLAAFVSIIVCSCSDYEKLLFKSAEVGRVGDLSLVDNAVRMDSDLNLVIENPTGSKFSMDDFGITIYTAQKKKFAEISLTGEKPAIRSHCTDTVKVGVKVNVENPLALVTMKSLDQAVESLQSKNMTIDCFFNVKQGIFGKKIEYKDVPFKDFMNLINNFKKK